MDPNPSSWSSNNSSNTGATTTTTPAASTSNRLVPVLDDNKERTKLVKGEEEEEEEEVAITSPVITTRNNDMRAAKPPRRGRKRRKKNLSHEDETANAKKPSPRGDDSSTTRHQQQQHSSSFQVITEHDVVLGDNQARDKRTTAATALLRSVKRQFVHAARPGQPKALWIPAATAAFGQKWKPKGRVLLRCTKTVMSSQRVHEADRNQFGFPDDAVANYGLAANPQQEFAKFFSNKDSPKLGQELAMHRQYYRAQMEQQQRELEPAVHQLLVQFGERLAFFEELYRLQQEQDDDDAKQFLKDLSPINPLKNLLERLKQRIERVRQHSPPAVTTTRDFNRKPPPPTPSDNRKPPPAVSTIVSKSLVGPASEDTAAADHGQNGNPCPLNETACKLNESNAKDFREDNESPINSASHQSDAIAMDVGLVFDGEVEGQDLQTLKIGPDAASPGRTSFLREIERQTLSELDLLHASLGSFDADIEPPVGQLAEQTFEDLMETSDKQDSLDCIQPRPESVTCMPGAEGATESGTPVSLGSERLVQRRERKIKDSPGMSADKGPEYEMVLQGSGGSSSDRSYLQRAIQSSSAGRSSALEPPDERPQDIIRRGETYPSAQRSDAAQPPEPTGPTAAKSRRPEESVQEDTLTSVTAHVANVPRISFGRWHIDGSASASVDDKDLLYHVEELPSHLEYKDQGRNISEFLGSTPVIVEAAPPPDCCSSRAPATQATVAGPTGAFTPPQTPSAARPRRLRWMELLLCFCRWTRRVETCSRPNPPSVQMPNRNLSNQVSPCLADPRLRKLGTTRNEETPKARREGSTGCIPVPVSSYALSECVVMTPQSSSERLSALAETSCENETLARTPQQSMRINEVPRTSPATNTSTDGSAAVDRNPNGLCAARHEIEIFADRPVESDLPIGLYFGQDPESRLCVTRITDDSIFADSDLSEGMLVLRINEFAGLSVQEATRLIGRIQGPITIVAIPGADGKQNGSDDADTPHPAAVVTNRPLAQVAFVDSTTEQNGETISPDRVAFATLVDDEDAEDP